MKTQKISNACEKIAMVSGIACLVGVSALVYVIFRDWREGNLNTGLEYIRLCGFIILPFLATGLVCLFVIRKTNNTDKS